MTMTSVKNKMGETLINVGTSIANQGEKLTNNGNYRPTVRQSILNIDLTGAPGTGISYTRARQQIRFK